MEENVLDLAGRREAVLDLLRDGPQPKRDVIDRTGHSRSTVDRALESLLEAGLVVARDGGYETTSAGVLALEARRAYDREARAIVHAAPALEPLWKETPVSRAFVRDAAVSLVEDVSTRPLFDLRAIVRGADSLRVLLPSLPDAGFLDALTSAAARADDGTDRPPLVIVTTDTLFGRLAEDHAGWLRTLVTEGDATVYTGEVPDFGLVHATGIDGSVAAVQVYDEGRLHALLRADGEEAVGWAERTVTDALADADDRTEDAATLESVTPRGGPGSVGGGCARATRPAETPDTDDTLLGGGYAVDHGGLRTPAFGTEGACTVACWVDADGFDTDWEMLVKWDYLALAYRRGVVYGQVFDPDREVERARVAVDADRLVEGWHHLVYTYDESTARLYLDGEAVGETADDYPLRIQPIGAAVGYFYRDRDPGVHDPTFEGRLADVRFYGSALDGETVRRLYRATRPDGV